MTSMAMSAAAPPLFLRFAKASWPGVSMTSKPGIRTLPFSVFSSGPQICLRVLTGK